MPAGWHERWLENAARRGVDAATVDDVVRRHGIGPDDVAVLEGLAELTDPGGASFFVLSDDIGAAEARRAVLMTCVVNAGTGYAGRTDLVRLLHHEERHSQQWAEAGPVRFVASYVWERVRGRNDTEEGAGLRDGGYR